MTDHAAVIREFIDRRKPTAGEPPAALAALDALAELDETP